MLLLGNSNFYYYYYYYYSPNRSAVCSPVNVLFENNGQSLKLGEIKLEKSQVCLVPAVKKISTIISVRKTLFQIYPGLVVCLLITF